MTVRVLRAGDAAAMAAIHTRCFEKSWPALDMTVHIKRDLCLGLGEPLVSFAIIRLSDVDGEILTVATDPDAQGQGLAGHVIKTARTRLELLGLRHLFLEVADDNHAARALYHRLGFQPIGRRPAYYRRADGRVAAITYALKLAGAASASLDDSLSDR